MEINQIAVLGSGVMGAGIAAHCANAGLSVLLLDIVPVGATNRNELAEKAIIRQLASGGFTHPDNAQRVRAGNLEDHIAELAKADWIIEAVLERLDVKHDVYRKVDAVRKPTAVVSSNTSTIPLHTLCEGMSEGFQRHFMIAHFFNPPRYMRLLEVVAGSKTSRKAYEAVQAFADERLGKQVVECKDTPGFIANRIGVYWMVVGLLEAIRLGVRVEDADAVMGRPVGIPKTGVFGLYDLIGIDLIPLIAKSMMAGLPASDAFCEAYQLPALVEKMIADGYTGRKGKGGFYRMNKVGDAKIKEVISLKTGEYAPEQAFSLASAKAKSVAELMAAEDAGGKYAWAVLSATLHYAASLVPEIADDISAVDAAMCTGYSWKYGPFELLDAIGVDTFIQRLKAEGREVPALLAKAAGQCFYKDQTHLSASGAYVPVKRVAGHLSLTDVKLGKAPVVSNASANLWDMGEGIACLEFTSKMNAVDHNILAMIEQVTVRVQQDFKGLVIGNDTDVFSAGANLSVFLAHAEACEWAAISDIIMRGQQAMMGVKYAPFPVVAALSGLALGGGCEVVLHADAVQAHMECSPGLVEPNVGLIPAWGGCKEMLLRVDSAVAFDAIVAAKMAGSADDARAMGILNAKSAVTMNRARLLADAKARALSLSKGYAPVKSAPITPANKDALLTRLEALAEASKLTPHSTVIGRVLAHVLSGGGETTATEAEILALEHEGFMELIRTTASQERIAHMLKTGKPLKN